MNNITKFLNDNIETLKLVVKGIAIACIYKICDKAIDNGYGVSLVAPNNAQLNLTK